MEYELPILIEYDEEDNVYLAECPVLQGCYTDGKTYEEARRNVQDAIKLMIEARLVVGDPIPTFEMMRVVA